MADNHDSLAHRAKNVLYEKIQVLQGYLGQTRMTCGRDSWQVCVCDEESHVRACQCTIQSQAILLFNLLVHICSLASEYEECIHLFKLFSSAVRADVIFFLFLQFPLDSRD
jgi:hypothetical protein